MKTYYYLFIILEDNFLVVFNYYEFSFNSINHIFCLLIGYICIRAYYTWQCGSGCFSNNFHVEMHANDFFYFLKIIFDISTSKRFKTYKPY